MTPSRPIATPAPAALQASLVPALFVLALALRPQLSAVGPLVPGIIGDLGVSHAFVGLLTTIPVLCMGVFALVGPSVAGWFGTRRGIALSVLVLIASAALRAVAPSAGLVLAATFGVGVGTAIVGPILAMFVHDRMPGHMVGGTSSYAGGTIVGAAIGAALAVPLAAALGGWRGSLLALALASLLCVAVWLLVVRPRTGDAHGVAHVRALHLPKLPGRRPVAWAIGILFGLQSWLFYGINAWLPSIYIETGWTDGAAALLLSSVSLASLVAILFVPTGARRGISRRAMLTAAATSSTAGLLGVALAPDLAPIWAAMMGAGLGTTFTLLLTLPTDIGANPREVGGASAMMLLVGYTLASIGPFALGATRDATGSFSAGVWLLVAIGVAMIPLSWSLSPQRLHRRNDPQAA